MKNCTGYYYALNVTLLYILFVGTAHLGLLNSEMPWNGAHLLAAKAAGGSTHKNKGSTGAMLDLFKMTPVMGVPLIACLSNFYELSHLMYACVCAHTTLEFTWKNKQHYCISDTTYLLFMWFTTSTCQTVFHCMWVWWIVLIFCVCVRASVCLFVCVCVCVHLDEEAMEDAGSEEEESSSEGGGDERDDCMKEKKGNWNKKNK